MNPDFIGLIGLLDQELKERNGPVQMEYVQFNKIIERLETVVVLYESGIPAGCGCFRVHDHETIEIKRMFVMPQSRGKGYSKLILSELETWAVETGYQFAILETGAPHPEAIGLYKNSGYTRIPNYGPYAAMPNSLCFHKILNINKII